LVVADSLPLTASRFWSLATRENYQWIREKCRWSVYKRRDTHWISTSLQNPKFMRLNDLRFPLH